MACIALHCSTVSLQGGMYCVLYYTVLQYNVPAGGSGVLRVDGSDHITGAAQLLTQLYSTALL